MAELTCDGCGRPFDLAELTAGECETRWCSGCVADAVAANHMAPEVASNAELQARRRVGVRTRSVLHRSTALALLTLVSTPVHDPQPRHTPDFSKPKHRRRVSKKRQRGSK